MASHKTMKTISFCRVVVDGNSRAVSVTIPQLPGASALAPANMAGRNAAAMEPVTIQMDHPMQEGMGELPSPQPQQTSLT